MENIKKFFSKKKLLIVLFIVSAISAISFFAPRIFESYAAASNPGHNLSQIAIDQDLNMGGFRIGSGGFSPNSGYPVGWGGGVHTWDVYAEGSVGVGQSPTLTAYIQNDTTNRGLGYFKNSVGIGITPGADSDKLTIDGGGIVMYNAPSNGIVVTGGSAASGVVGMGQGAGNGMAGLIIDNSFGNGVSGMTKFGNAVAGTCLGVAGDTCVGVFANGTWFDFYAYGPGIDYGSSSSVRWKENIKPIDNALAMVLDLRGVYFDWKEEYGGKHGMGMIAEEAGKIVPEIVSYEENGVDATGMDYGHLTPILVEAIKEQQKQIEELRNEIKNLKAELNGNIENN